MKTRILYVNTVKTTRVLLVISMFMIGKKGFSVTVVNSELTENVPDWLSRNIRKQLLKKKRFGTARRAQNTSFHSMKSIIHN